jgi:demethylmenaquinone methyltransferase/2-methoxy-6-polyprenyl-1,4-benzoquinol methylase
LADAPAAQACNEGSVALPPRARSYQLVAPFYEELAQLLSRGRIHAAKLSQLAWLEPGDRVLYAGVGSGEDAAAAARAGARVTALDVSPRMLGRLERRLGADASRVQLRCEDFARHEGGPYDVVVLNFFLNVFGPDEMPHVLERGVAMLAGSRSRLMIADFTPPKHSLERIVFELHYRPLLLASWALGLSALHPIYDYRGFVEARGLGLLESKRFALFGSRFEFYESLVFRAPG